MNLFEKIAKKNDNSSVLNKGLGTATLGALGTAIHYGGKKVLSDRLIKSSKNKIKELEERLSNPYLGLGYREISYYKGLIAENRDFIKEETKEAKRFGRNAKFSLGLAGLGAAGLGYNYLKNN